MNEEKKYVDIETLQHYDELLKQYIKKAFNTTPQGDNSLTTLNDIPPKKEGGE